MLILRQLELIRGLILHELLVFLSDLFINSEDVCNEGLRAVDLLRFHGLVTIHSDRHVILLLHLTGANFTLQLVEISSVRNLDPLAWRDDLIIEVIIIVVSHLILKQ